MKGKFNAQEANSFVKNDSNFCDFKHLIVEPKYFKKPMNPKYIDLLNT